ncbi:rho guanine nucleotide exchange factor 25 isoform X1 [Tachysurus vachellii]|uniref:rho guanine nucleotide exchange factor 25 isoform X1 n=1 Tax=Tachysurus vachellii TaxID=175792 RepID=UPI00296A9261|nr:rho guanine nucleotide exchange factor 25 isoform X1 [Tachysurus vachellii]
MKPLQKNQGRTDHILGAMADMLSSLAMPSQHWSSEGTEELPVDGERKAASQSQWDQERVEWEQESRDSPERGQRDKEDSYTAAGSEGSISTSVTSLPPQASGSSAPNSPGSRHSVSTLKKWLTNPVRKLSVGSVGGIKGERATRRLEGKAPPLPSRSNPELGNNRATEDRATIFTNTEKELEWRDGHSASEDASGIPKSYRNQCDDSLQGSTSLGPTQNPQPSDLQLDGNGSVLMDDTSSQSSVTADSEEERRSAMEKSMYVLEELIETEKLYVADLGLIVDGYMATLNAKGVPEDMKGKDKIVFGNIHQIYDWHKDYFLGELEKCVEEPERLAQLFIKHERRLHMYVVYCQNKPKSEHIVSEYIDTYFEELKQQLGHRLQLNDLLIKPVQRIMKYQLLLKDFLKYYTKAGMDTEDLEKAVEVMCFVPKRCNDMMNVGRLQGFEGKITAQGKLLQQDTFTVTEQDSSFLSRPKERRVFLFEQIVIFSEPIDRKKGFSIPGYIFKNSIKMSCLGIEACVDGDPTRFALTSRGADGNTIRFVLQSFSVDISGSWVSDVNQILETQRNFLNALQSPIEYQRRESKSNSLGRTMRPPVCAASGLRPHSSASMDRQRAPCLRAYNTSLPSLYLSSQGPGDMSAQLESTQRCKLESQLEAQTVSPTHVHLAFSEEPRFSPAVHSCQTVSNGVYPIGAQGSQAGEGGSRAPLWEIQTSAPGASSSLQHSNHLAQLDEDEL